MHVPVSACLIVKNDPHLARTIGSIRPFVDEICIVDTGSTDGTAETAKRLADRFEVFTACNFEDGEIADFSAARNHSFALASHPTVLWVDSDDVVEGLKHLQEAIAWSTEKAQGQPWRTKFPYDYDQDERGRCISWQLRERIVHPKEAFHWGYRVHEGLTAIQANEWKTLEPPPVPIVWHHELDKRKPRSRRNLRILLDHVKQVGQENVDTKTRFDLGQEYAKTGDHRLAIVWFGSYIDLSDLPDDRALACLHIVDILCFWPGRDQDAAWWAHKATELRPGWAEGYWALAKIAYGVANKTKSAELERRQLRRTVHFARVGLAKASTRTDVPINPLDRTVNIPAILQDALSRLGDARGALLAMRECAAAALDDVGLQLRLRECELAVDPSHALDVAIVCGITAEAWDPSTAAREGIGGSETAVIEVSRRLVKLGCRVRVFCRCDHPGLYDGVEYRSMGQADEASGCDLLVAWRNARLLETSAARVKWLWVHDTEIGWSTAWNLCLADRILGVSEWHAEHLREAHPKIADRIEATRNGIDLTRFEANAIQRHPHRAVYSSSPDRGLDQLLAMWPRIRARVPNAELHVYYGFATFPQEVVVEWHNKIETLADQGVVIHGRVDQQTLAEVMLSSGVWVHPSWWGEQPFEETSCIGSMEAQAAGLHVVCGGFGALPENVKHGALIFGDAREPGFQTDFVDAVVEAMQREGPRSAIQAEARERFGWDDVAKSWMDRILSDLSSTAPIAKTSSGDPRDRRPVLHAILAPLASGEIVMNAAGDPGAESMGGGSRVGFLGLIKAMGALGTYRVRAFSTFKDPIVVRDGIEYIRLDRMTQYTDPDIVFAYYDTSPLASYGPDVLRIASHHTYAPYMHFTSADVNTAPSEHAMQVLRDRFDPTGHWEVLPNAVGVLDVQRNPVPGRILYHTSPDRGLSPLLKAYPAIKRAVPGATLHLVGAVREILDCKPPKGRPGDWMREIQSAYAEAEPLGGIVLLGRLPRAELWRELGEASVFAYPCSPPAPCETFSVSILECCKIGLPVVLAPADALESIYAGHVRMTPSPVREHLDEFTDAVVDVLTSEFEASRVAAAGKDLAAQFTFAKTANVLDRIIETQMQARKMGDLAAAE